LADLIDHRSALLAKETPGGRKASPLGEQAAR
jgi:hypothetical protein